MTSIQLKDKLKKYNGESFDEGHMYIVRIYNKLEDQPLIFLAECSRFENREYLIFSDGYIPLKKDIISYYKLGDEL